VVERSGGDEPQNRGAEGGALARKPLAALWKYASAGVVVEGAVVKAELAGRRTLKREDSSSGGSGRTNRAAHGLKRR